MLFIVSKEVGKMNFEKDPIFITIKDLKFKDKIIIDCEITDNEMKGIFVSDKYTLIDGHIYYNNNVIKLRYDLMQQYGPGQEYHSIYFNIYNNILQLGPTETVKMNSPLDSQLTHKFAYIIVNHALEPKRLTMLPYLHERKIYMNRIKQNTKYFYSSKQTVVHECSGDRETDGV